MELLTGLCFEEERSTKYHLSSSGAMCGIRGWWISRRDLIGIQWRRLVTTEGIKWRLDCIGRFVCSCFFLLVWYEPFWTTAFSQASGCETTRSRRSRCEPSNCWSFWWRIGGFRKVERNGTNVDKALFQNTVLCKEKVRQRSAAKETQTKSETTKQNVNENQKNILSFFSFVINDKISARLFESWKRRLFFYSGARVANKQLLKQFSTSQTILWLQFFKQLVIYFSVAASVQNLNWINIVKLTTIMIQNLKSKQIFFFRKYDFFVSFSHYFVIQRVSECVYNCRLPRISHTSKLSHRSTQSNLVFKKKISVVYVLFKSTRFNRIATIFHQSFPSLQKPPTTQENKKQTQLTIKKPHYQSISSIRRSANGTDVRANESQWGGVSNVSAR